MESVQSYIGSLQVDRTEACVHHSVRVNWDFSNSAYVPNSRDFIAVFEVGKWTGMHATPLDMRVCCICGYERIVQIKLTVV